MTRNVTFIIAMMAAATMTAAVPEQSEQTVNGRTETPACVYKEVSENAARKTPATRAEGWKFDVSADEIIYDQPVGDLKLYSKACEYYGISVWGTVQGSSDGMPCNVVIGDDGSFYIYNPFSGIDSKTWLKATVEGDKMTIKLPQAVYADSDGTTDYVYVAQMCHYEWTNDNHESGLYYPEDGETEIVFNKEGETWVMQPTEEVNEHPMVMALVSADDGTWCVYSDWNIRLTPFTETLVTPPASMEIQKYEMKYLVNDNYYCGNYVNVGFDGNDVYLSGISSLFPESWIKGTVSDGKLEFPSGQYVGADEMSNAFGFFSGFKQERKYNEEYEYWYNETTKEPSLIFELDPESEVYSTTQALGVTKGENGTYYIDLFKQPKLEKTKEITDFTPMNPVLNFYSAPGSYAGSLYFDFPTLNVNGQLLDVNNLNYRVFVDGELFEFYSDEYEGVEDGTTDVPFTFTNYYTLGYMGTGYITHYFSIAFYGYKTIDVQTFYLDGETEYASDIVRMVDTTVSVGSVDAESRIVAEKWYDLSGRLVENPENGIYIKHVEYADGSVKAFKAVIK